MARKQERGIKVDLRPDLNQDEELDLQSATALLSAEYPLIDAPLIIALLSDYTPLRDAHLEEIRSQLGVIEATLVPDSEAVAEDNHLLEDPSDHASSSASGGAQLLDAKLTQLALNDPPPFASPGSPQPIRNGTNSSSRKSRSTSVSGSHTSTATSATSVVDSDGGFEDDLILLKTLFPAMSDQDLKDALVSQSGVPAAIDFLLSLELIRGVEREGHWPGEDDGAVSSEPEHSSKSDAKAKPIPHSIAPVARKSRKTTTKILPLVDTLQRRSTRSSSRPSSRPTSRPSSRASSRDRSAIAGPSSNAWGTVSSLAEFLSDIISERPSSYFLSHLHSPENRSAYLAVRSALRALPPKNVGSDTTETSRGILEDIYGLSLQGGGSRAAKDDLEICVRVVGDDVAAVMDLMDLLGEISQWPGDDEFEKYDAVQETGWSKSALSQEIDGWTTATYEPEKPKIEMDEDWGMPIRTNGNLSSEEAAPSTSKPPGSPRTGSRNSNRLTQRPKASQPLITKPKIVVGSQAPPSAWSSPTAYDDFGSPSNFGSTAKSRNRSKERQIHPQNWRTVHHARLRPDKVLHPLASSIPSYGRGQTPHDSTPGSLYNTSPSSAQINEYLQYAQVERAKRESAIRAAGRQYRGGLAGGKAVNASVAGHYALQAREATEAARGWEMKAARMIVSDQLNQSGHTIDLHHLTIEEAVTVALESASSWYEREKVRSFGGIAQQSTTKAVGFVPVRGLTVVVGVGRHSAGQKGVLGPAVANALEGAGWRVDRGENGRGYLMVRGKR